jgi:hypothetical protein
MRIRDQGWKKFGSMDPGKTSRIRHRFWVQLYLTLYSDGLEGLLLPVEAVGDAGDLNPRQVVAHRHLQHRHCPESTLARHLLE